MEKLSLQEHKQLEGRYVISVPSYFMSSVTLLRNKIRSCLCELRQISNINSSAILAPLAFMLMPKTSIKFCKVCLFVSFLWDNYL